MEPATRPGFAALPRSHQHLLAIGTERLPAGERALALAALSEVAVMALHRACQVTVKAERFPDRIQAAALDHLWPVLTSASRGAE